jgi:hypothetical protein
LSGLVYVGRTFSKPTPSCFPPQAAAALDKWRRHTFGGKLWLTTMMLLLLMLLVMRMETGNGQV